MNREDIEQWTREAGGFDATPEFLAKFAALVASAERERIKQANAPEIERVNAYIKELEDAIKAEREACAKVCDDINAKYKWPQDTAERVASQWCADTIRARGDNK